MGNPGVGVAVAVESEHEDDRAAFAELYREVREPLVAYCRRLVGGGGDAESLAQEALLRAWLSWDRDAGRPLWPWVLTVARNLIIDERRSARFRNESGTADVEAIADRAGPDEVDNALDKLLLSTALSQLSEDHRAVILRAYYEGWSVAQTAADLQIAEGTVKSRLHYAVRALRLNLQEMGVTR